jgi:DNA-binding SARP family transcriptional activator/pimeloyl-ACP methyl ester carboxylesterase
MEARSLELFLIGEVAVRRDGQLAPLPASKKTRALLAYLAAEPREHRREALCSLFWNVPDDPKGSLRWSLSKLRQTVDEPGRSRLIADRDTVRLDLSGASCDFDDIAKAAVCGEPDELAAAGARRGEFAPGVDLRGCDEFDSWLAATREDVRQRLLAVWRALVERNATEPARALPFARRMVEEDPLDEGGWQRLIELLRKLGRNDEAAAQRDVALRTLEGAGLPVPASLRQVPRQARRVPPPSIAQRVEFCTASDGTGLAYSCVGTGPPLVKTANWLNHLEFEWESPIWRHWIEELSRDRTLLRYDERGNGLSDWKVAELSFEAFVDDLETVIGAAGLDRFDLLGISQGCAVSIAYAVRHPEKVRRLVLYGGYSQGWAKRNDPDELARREAMYTLVGFGWGQDNPAFRQMFTSLYFPNATAEQAKWFNELQRISASPEGAQRLQRTLSQIDVRHLLRKVQTPTLVMHCRDDAVIPFEAGRILARHIPGARFVALDSPNHLVLGDEPAWPKLVGHLREFLAEE